MQSKIEQKVMASVGVIYTARQLINATALKLYVCAASAYALVQLVWVHKVFANLEAVGWRGAGEFIAYAFLHTALPVQLVTLVLAAAALSLVADLIPRPQIRYR